MKKRIKWFCLSIMFLPFLFGFWVLIGFLFISIPFIAFINPDFFYKKEEQ